MAVREVLQRAFSWRATPSAAPPARRRTNQRATPTVAASQSRVNPLETLQRRLQVETDPRLAFIDALLSNPRGRLEEYGAVHARLLDVDRDFYAHLAAWYYANGVVQDHQVLFCAHLAISHEDSHREAVEKLASNLFPIVPIPEVKSKWTQ